MEVCVKQGEIVNKHLKVEMNVGDVLCYGLDEKLIGCLFAIRGLCIGLWAYSCLMIFCGLTFFPEMRQLNAVRHVETKEAASRTTSK